VVLVAVMLVAAVAVVENDETPGGLVERQDSEGNGVADAPMFSHIESRIFIRHPITRW